MSYIGWVTWKKARLFGFDFTLQVSELVFTLENVLGQTLLFLFFLLMINLFVIAGCVTPSLASQVLQINMLLLSSVFSGRVYLFESQKNSFIYFAICRGTFSFIVEGTHFPPPSHKYLFEVGHWFQSFMKLLMRVLIESNHLMLWVRSAFSNILKFAFRNLPIYFAKSLLGNLSKTF